MPLNTASWIGLCFANMARACVSNWHCQYAYQMMNVTLLSGMSLEVIENECKYGS